MSKKNYLSDWPALLMAAMLSVGFASCGDDEDLPAPLPNDGNEKTDVVSNQDPEGTVVVNMNNGAKDNWIDIGIGIKIHIDEANNFVGESWGNAEFVSLGLVSGLSDVITIPSAGWSKAAAVVPGTGYIVRYGGKYARLYVVDYTVSTSGGIMGATVKYQSPFQLPIILETTSLTFSSEASSQTIKLKNPTSVTVESQPGWCNVTQNDINSINVSVYENIVARESSGEIVLKNSIGSVTLNVVQKGSTAPKFEAGRGTATDPYQIKTAQQLDNVRLYLNSHFILIADINLSSYLNEYGNGWEPIGKDEARFRGTIDGKMHTIKVLDVPMKKLRDKGVPIDNLSNYETAKEELLYAGPLAEVVKSEFFFVTEKGFVKRTSGAEFVSSVRTIQSTKLQEGDRLILVSPDDHMEYAVLMSSDGCFLKFALLEASELKKTAVGVKGMTLSAGSTVKQAYLLENAREFTIDYHGSRLSLNRLKTAKRGGKGTKSRK